MSLPSIKAQKHSFVVFSLNLVLTFILKSISHLVNFHAKYQLRFISFCLRASSHVSTIPCKVYCLSIDLPLPTPHHHIYAHMFHLSMFQSYKLYRPIIVLKFSKYSYFQVHQIPFRLCCLWINEVRVSTVHC